MTITATHISYFFICHRKLWLFANGINMEHTSDVVYDGKLLHETSYPQRAEKYSEIELSATIDNIELSGRIDFYDAKEKIIHEIKRNNKVEEAHEWQVKYYIWLLELNNISGTHAILEYPILRHKNMVALTQSDREHLQKTVAHIINLIQDDNCPSKINAKICKSCSYYELCYIEET